MPLGRNPFASTKRGDVLAIRFGPLQWGFIRYRGFSGFGVLPYFGDAAGLPDIQWRDDIEKWFHFDGSKPGRLDAELYRKVGNVSFDNEATDMPPRYQEPDPPVLTRYSIIYSNPPRMEFVNSVEDVKGIQKSGPMLSPEKIAEVIRDKFEAGLLSKVNVLQAQKVQGRKRS